MAEITKFPVEKVYPTSVKGREIWDQAEPPSEMVWAVCPWMKTHRDESRCHRCPRYETDPDYGQVQRGCYGIAAEVCRVVFAMQNRETKGIAMDDKDSLLSIARELRRFAGAAYGKPERVPITAANLTDLADRLERIATGEIRPDESERA